MPGASPRRVVMSRIKGFRMPPNTVCVDRRTMWGNPFKVGGRYKIMGQITDIVTAEQAVEAFEYWLLDGDGQNIFARIGELRGLNLACWCKKGCTCHADILLKWANGGGAK